MDKAAKQAAAERAEAAAELRHGLVMRRKVPCICPEQPDKRGPRGGRKPGTGARAKTLSYTTGNGVLVERVACEQCCRTWKRVTV